jgi:protein MpaA
MSRATGESSLVPASRVTHSGPLLALAAACGSLLLLPGVAGAGVRHVMLGRSVEGRPIVAEEVGDPTSARKVLVVGCIDGNEPAGIAIAERLERLQPRHVDLWIVPDLNPDGRAAGTLGNADGVDLNRNFPWRWRRLSGALSSGPRPLSEPESRAAYRLIRRLRPRLSVWFHQHMAVVDDSQGSVALERRFARLVGLPLARLTDYPGSVAGWENHLLLPASTAFVVELPAGTLSPVAARRYSRAVLAVA